MTTALLILTLNEIDGVKKIIPEIKREWVDEILVVDGGSTDGTVEEVKKMGLNIIQQKTRGHGQAILTGVNHTKSNNIVVFGPDGNQPVTDTADDDELTTTDFIGGSESNCVKRIGRNQN